MAITEAAILEALHRRVDQGNFGYGMAVESVAVDGKAATFNLLYALPMLLLNQYR